jgi:L-fucose mutarotase
MLKGIDPLLNAELLHILAGMGHGDELAVVDANFPAVTMARRLVRLDGATATRALQAVLSLMPLDDFVDAPVAAMQVVGDPNAIPEVVKEFHEVANKAEGKKVTMERIDRFAFYERVKAACAVVATGEQRLYGNVLVKKGVIRPD